MVSVVSFIAGKRELLTLARTKEILANALNISLNDLIMEKIDFKLIKEVHLGSKSFNVESAKFIADFLLKNCINLEIVDLSDIIAGREESIALEVLFILCDAAFQTDRKITSIDLSENALGEKGIRKLEGTIRRLIHLREVKFFNNGLSALSMKLLCDYLPKQKLQKLLFHNNMSGDDGAIAFANLLKQKANADGGFPVEEVRMSSCRVKSVGGEALIEIGVSSIAESLCKLDLSDSMFGEDVAEKLADLLQNLNGVKDLSLRDTGLEVEGVKLIIDRLLDTQILPKLENLDLSCLEIGDDEGESDEDYKPLCKKLGQIIHQRPLLKKLHLEENNFESEGIRALVDGFEYHAKRGDASMELCHLSLKTNMMGGNGGVLISNLSHKHFKNLQILELDDNCFSEDALEAMKTIMGEEKFEKMVGELEENDPNGDEDELEKVSEASDDLAELERQFKSSLRVSEK